MGSESPPGIQTSLQAQWEQANLGLFRASRTGGYRRFVTKNLFQNCSCSPTRRCKTASAAQRWKRLLGLLSLDAKEALRSRYVYEIP